MTVHEEAADGRDSAARAGEGGGRRRAPLRRAASSFWNNAPDGSIVGAARAVAELLAKTREAAERSRELRRIERERGDRR